MARVLSLRADRTPNNSPRARVTTVATSTLASVCMLCSHSPSRMTNTRQMPATVAARSPDTAQPMTPTAATTSHHGELVRTSSSGLRM